MAAAKGCQCESKGVNLSDPRMILPVKTKIINGQAIEAVLSPQRSPTLIRTHLWSQKIAGRVLWQERHTRWPWVPPARARQPWLAPLRSPDCSCRTRPDGSVAPCPPKRPPEWARSGCRKRRSRGPASSQYCRSRASSADLAVRNANCLPKRRTWPRLTLSGTNLDGAAAPRASVWCAGPTRGRALRATPPKPLQRLSPLWRQGGPLRLSLSQGGAIGTYGPDTSPVMSDQALTIAKVYIIPAAFGKRPLPPSMIRCKPPARQG